MPEIIPNYHPFMVHFTISLIVVSFGMLLLAYVLKTKPRIQEECFIVSRWCLWLAALASGLTIVAGFHAYYTVGHDAISHKVMTIHRNWGMTTFMIIWLMAIWSFILHLKNKSPRWLFAVSLAVTVILVMVTGWYGAELVFRYGTGVKSLPQVEIVGHQHVGDNHSFVQKTTKDGHANHEH